MKDTLSRRNRCFEYDAVSEDNVRFLVEELLPFVASQYGLKFATGLAYRPDQWLLSVADGHSKWAYSYQIKDDGTLINKERFFWLQVLDGDDDTGAESVTYAREGQMFVAMRSGIQVCAEDGPTHLCPTAAGPPACALGAASRMCSSHFVATKSGNAGCRSTPWGPSPRGAKCREQSCEPGRAVRFVFACRGWQMRVGG